jgi:hypothetical protein
VFQGIARPAKRWLEPISAAYRFDEPFGAAVTSVGEVEGKFGSTISGALFLDGSMVMPMRFESKDKGAPIWQPEPYHFRH